jgi:hypothetical protein
VDIETDVDPVFLSPLHGLVDVPEGFLMNDVPIPIFNPDSVIHGQTGVVETPIGNELEVFLVEPLVAVLEGITPLEVETPPTGQERGGGFG